MRACAAISAKPTRRRAASVKSSTPSAPGEERQRIVADGDAEQRQSGEHAGIGADHVGIGSLDRPGQADAVRLGDGADQRAAHAAAGADDNETHIRREGRFGRRSLVGHGGVPKLRDAI